MARQLTWVDNSGDGWRDFIGLLGSIRSFSIAEDSNDKGDPNGKLILTSMWIPCKQRKRVFRDVEEAKSAAQKTVDGFADWIATGAR